MFPIKKIIINIIFIDIIIKLEGLVELPSVEDNDIQVAEAVIRNTINALFSSLNFKGIKHNPKLKQYSTVHNYFVSLTLKDHNNLKEIAKFSRVDNKNVDSGTTIFIAVLNELLNEDSNVNSNNTEVNNEINSNDENVIKYIVNFLNNLKHLKETYAVTNNFANFNINAEILKILQNRDGAQFNVTSDDNKNLVNSTEDDRVLSENEYWQSNGRRIYRGKRTKIKHFPFMASIQIFHQFQCGGSIVKSDLIITAASCLQLAYNNRFFRENPAFLSVRVGTNFYNGGGEDISVLEVYFNPEYNPKNLRNNLCLLRLRRRLKFSKKHKKVKKIDIDRHSSALPMMTDGVTVVGWGARSESNILGDPWSNQLAFSVLDVYPLQDCQEIYSSEYVTKKNFCAGFLSKGGGACNRDVGGPGIIHGILGGVISFGSPVCGTPDAPTVFTKLGYYSHWIDKIISQHVPHAMARTTLKKKYSLTMPPSHTTHATTSYNIPPLESKMKPIPINSQNALRLVDDDDLFQEFLTTMFDSKEIKEFQDAVSKEENDVVLNNDISVLKNIIRQPVAEIALNALESSKNPFTEQYVTEPVGIATKMDNFDYVSFTKADKKITLLDQNLVMEASDSESEVVEMKDDSSVESLGNSESVSSDSEQLKWLNDKVEKRWNKVDDSVLTLLYISDNETLKENKKNIDNESKDIITDLDSFNDITVKKKSDPAEFFDFLPKDELYNLLSETIDMEMRNKEKY